jgi:hypothetical protein
MVESTVSPSPRRSTRSARHGRRPSRWRLTLRSAAVCALSAGKSVTQGDFMIVGVGSGTVTSRMVFPAVGLGGLGGREPVADGDGESVKSWLLSHRPRGAAGSGPAQGVGGRGARVHREGAFGVGAQESWTVVASRSSIEPGIGCFCWASCAGLGGSFRPGLLSGETARRGVAVPGEPRRGRLAQIVDGCWRAVW